MRRNASIPSSRRTILPRRFSQGTTDDAPAPWVEDPIGNHAAAGYLAGMNTLLILVVLLLLLGGGGFYFGGPAIGGGGLGLVLLICLVVFLMGGFRTKS